jgi:hypothetical protein
MNRTPSCSNCKYYIRESRSAILNRCSRFEWYFKNQTKYEYADNCRKDEQKCGKNGIYFESNLIDSIYFTDDNSVK